MSASTCRVVVLSVAFIMTAWFGTWSAAHAEGAADADVWQPLRPLVGAWTGGGEGFGSTSSVSHQWDFVISGNYLRLRTRSVSEAADGSEDVHEDVGFISHDTDAGGFVFRQFLSEGYVNTYDLQFADDGSILFASRETESGGGMRAQLRVRFESDARYEMFLDLAMPDKPFAECQRMKLARVEG
jgi:hypothetical protein